MITQLAKLIAGLILFLSFSGCATYHVWDGQGIEAEAPDNPEVVVRSDVEFINHTYPGEVTIGVSLTPPLAISFERAMERYVDEGTFRIVEAEMSVVTMLSDQTAILWMVVEFEDETFDLRNKWETDSAGFSGKKPYKLIPEYLDNCARQLAEAIQNRR